MNNTFKQILIFSSLLASIGIAVVARDIAQRVAIAYTLGVLLHAHLADSNSLFEVKVPTSWAFGLMAQRLSSTPGGEVQNDSISQEERGLVRVYFVFIGLHLTSFWCGVVTALIAFGIWQPAGRVNSTAGPIAISSSMAIDSTNSMNTRDAPAESEG